ncbi:MAG: hypothetical protein HUU57_05390 [Bdellovibrio sp.]|nr:hypothetical protein [Bdellovibrio sp.]
MNTVGGAALESYIAKEEELFNQTTPSYAQMLRLMNEVKAEDLNRLAQERIYQQNGLTHPGVFGSRFMKYLSR